MKKWTRWQDWVAAAAGVYVALSVLWTTQAGSSMPIMITLGVLLAVAAVWSLAMPGLVTMEWIHVVIGALLVISPWVGSYATQAGVAWTSWICGAVAIVVGALAIQPARQEQEHRSPITH
jgi:UPF0716 family protein affecting phage T7 exclusion